MKMLQRSFSLLAILFLTGCSNIKFYYQDDLTYIDTLIEDNQYEVALRYVDRKDKKSPNYAQLQQRRPVILSNMQSYEQLMLTQSQKLVESERWSDAIRLLEGALSNIPKSRRLAQEIVQMKGDRDNEISLLQQQLILNEAHALKEDRPLYLRLYKFDPDISLSPEAVQQRSADVATELLKWATSYVREKETVKARNFLKLAGEITPKIRSSSEFRKLLGEIEQIERELSLVIKKKREIELEKLIKELNHLLQQGELVDAQIALNEIENRFDKSRTIRKLRKQLDSAVSHEISRHMESGMMFYSKEQIEQAINQWGHVLLLDPDNQDALENISRAVKVLTQLQQVRKNKSK
jgi:hypothetical protein